MTKPKPKKRPSKPRPLSAVQQAVAAAIEHRGAIVRHSARLAELEDFQRRHETHVHPGIDGKVIGLDRELRNELRGLSNRLDRNVKELNDAIAQERRERRFNAPAPPTIPDEAASAEATATPGAVKFTVPSRFKDPWSDVSTFRCATCMFWVPKPTPQFPELGRCRFQAPTLKGYPATFRTDFCGQHKIGRV